MDVSNEDVLHLATLSKLKLSDEEVESLKGDLTALINYVDKLSEVSCEGVEPTTHAVELNLRLRPDEVGEALDREAIVANAPDAEDGMFRVPRVVND